MFIQACFIFQIIKNILFVDLYMDNLIFTWSNQQMFKIFKLTMTQEFKMETQKDGDIGFKSYILGLEVKKTKEDNFLSLESYARESSRSLRWIIKLTKNDKGEKVDPT